MKNYICIHCKEEHSLYRECFLEWSVEDQEWIPAIINNEFFCYYCQKEVEIEEIILSHDQDM